MKRMGWSDVFVAPAKLWVRLLSERRDAGAWASHAVKLRSCSATTLQTELAVSRDSAVNAVGMLQCVDSGMSSCDSSIRSQMAERRFLAWQAWLTAILADLYGLRTWQSRKR